MSKQTENNNNPIVNDLDEDIFVALFRKGAYEYLEDSLLVEDNSSNDSLSETSEKRIMKMIKNQLRKERTAHFVKRLPKIAAIILIVFAVCTVTILSVEAFRVPVFSFFINTKEEITDIKINDELSPYEEEVETSHASEPTYLPEGFKLTTMEEFGEGFINSYYNSVGNSIIIYQLDIDSDLAVDTENAKYGSVEINGHEGFYSIKNGSSQLVFTTDDYAYWIIADLVILDVIKIAESIY